MTDSREIADYLEDKLGRPSLVDKTNKQEGRSNFYQFWDLSPDDVRKIRIILYANQGRFGVISRENFGDVETERTVWPAKTCNFIAEALDLV